jgi:hypothetical protein
MDEALKAGQVLEPESGMQLCARVTEADDANSVHSSVRRIRDRFPYPGWVLDDISRSIIDGGGLWCGSVMEQDPSCDHQNVFTELLSVLPRKTACVICLQCRAACVDQTVGVSG